MKNEPPSCILSQVISKKEKPNMKQIFEEKQTIPIESMVRTVYLPTNLPLTKSTFEIHGSVETKTVHPHGIWGKEPDLHYNHR